MMWDVIRGVEVGDGKGRVRVCWGREGGGIKKTFTYIFFYWHEKNLWLGKTEK